MKFLIDEDLSYKLVEFLVQIGHSATHIREIQISLTDSKILKIANEQRAIVLTFDKDFGELVFKENKSHDGVILLRLDNQTLRNTKRALVWFLSVYDEKNIKNKFVTINEKDSKFKARFKE